MATDPSIEDIIALIARALNEDVPMRHVISALERALLVTAKRRHGKWIRVHIALRIPRTTLHNKRIQHDID